MLKNSILSIFIGHNDYIIFKKDGTRAGYKPYVNDLVAFGVQNKIPMMDARSISTDDYEAIKSLPKAPTEETVSVWVQECKNLGMVAIHES